MTAAVHAAADDALQTVREALELLREDQERSKAALMSTRGGLRWGPASGRGFGGFGETVEVRSRFFRRLLDTRIEFAGWWARDDAFEFEIPLDGDVRVTRAPRIHMPGWDATTRRGLPELVTGAVYEYKRHVGEQGLSELLRITADAALRNLAYEIERHLVSLGPPSGDSRSGGGARRPAP